MELHAATSVLFLVIGAFLAGLNHTRYDVAISLFGVPLYDSKFHDVHHRIPQSNYGQYTMLWDHVLFGSFRYVPHVHYCFVISIFFMTKVFQSEKE